MPPISSSSASCAASKGVDVLLRALAEVARARPVHAVIVGSGPDREVFVKLAEELGLERIVTFTGAMPAALAFRRGRAIVVPSRAESLPYIVLEAAAAAMPLIATEAGGIPEIVEGSDTKLLPPERRLRACTRHARLSRRSQSGQDARRPAEETVQTRFAIDATTAAVLDFYGALLAS